MESRMEKYHEIDIDEFQRSKKNALLYKEVYGNYGDLEDLPIPENTNEIDIENLKTLVGSRASRRKEQIEKQDFDLEQDAIVMPKDDKVYDINTLLEIAKEENAKIKKDVPVSKNVPNYLANLESDKNTKDIILKYDGDSDDDLPIIKDIRGLTGEISLSGSNTADLSLDILSDLRPTSNTLLSEPIKDDNDELEGEKEFFDGSMKFFKEDFEDEEDADEFFYEQKDHLFLKILFIIIGLASVFTAAFFIIKEYTNIF